MCSSQCRAGSIPPSPPRSWSTTVTRSSGRRCSYGAARATPAAARSATWTTRDSVADHLGIDHRVFNFNEEFSAGVIERYVAEHASGRTPNPCVDCNTTLKFGAFAERAFRLGFDTIATGHHRATEDQTRRPAPSSRRRRPQRSVLRPFHPDEVAARPGGLAHRIVRQDRRQRARSDKGAADLRETREPGRLFHHLAVGSRGEATLRRVSDPDPPWRRRRCRDRRAAR